MANVYFNLNQIQSNPDGQPTVKRQSRLTSYPGEMNKKEQMSSTCPRFALVLPSFCSRLDSLSLVSRQSDLGNVCGISALFSTRVWKHVAMIFAVLVMSMANVGTAWAWATNVYLNGDFTGGNWSGSTAYSSTYQFKLKYSGTDGKFYLPVYASGSAQYFRLWTNNHCGPANDNTEIDAGDAGNAASSYDEHNWKYIGKAGIINVCVDILNEC